MSEVALSIALVTRNRPESLERALRSWRNQPAAPYEIVVSDDSSDELQPRVAALARQYGCRYVEGPRRGLYANRNHAALACTGSHILSADDDHEHPVDFLPRILEAVRREPDTVWCIGEYHEWLDHSAGTRLHRPGQLSAHGSMWPAPEGPEAACWAVSDGATVYPKALFDHGLRFYEGIRFGASYAEFGCLLHHFRWRIRVLSDTAVIHHLHEVGRSFDDPVNEAAATLFAMWMFSFYYQPRLSHQLVSLAKVPLYLMRRPAAALEIARRAFFHVRARRKEIDRMACYIPPTSTGA